MLRFLATASVLVAVTMTACPADAGVVVLRGAGGGSVQVKSFKERKFERVVRQQYDYSCGSAALATLLTYHFEQPTTEREAFDRMFELGDKERIRREGFSLYEMKLYLESLGYKADGFQVGLDKIARVGVPVIVMIEVKGYRHFVVIKGMQNGKILVGDSALGLKKWDVEDLQAALANDIVFAIHNVNEVGRRYFNAKREWAMLPSAPLGPSVSNQSLASFSVMLPAWNEFY